MFSSCEVQLPGKGLLWEKGRVEVWTDLSCSWVGVWGGEEREWGA